MTAGKNDPRAKLSKGNASIAAVLALLAAMSATPAVGRVYKTMDTAIKDVFQDAVVSRNSVFLTDEQVKRIELATGSEMESALVHPYEIREDELLVAVVYFDSHRVRTLRQTIMVAVGIDGALARVEALSFEEPEAYRPPEAWYRRLQGRRFGDGIEKGSAVDAVSGATISVRATVSAVGRILAIHNELYSTEEP